jgi:hypothetical protein
MFTKRILFGILEARRPYRLSVRTQPSQGWKPGSTPGKVTFQKSARKCDFCYVTLRK